MAQRPKTRYILDAATYLFIPKDADGNPILSQSESYDELVSDSQAVTLNVYKRRAEQV